MAMAPSYPPSMYPSKDQELRLYRVTMPESEYNYVVINSCDVLQNPHERSFAGIIVVGLLAFRVLTTSTHKRLTSHHNTQIVAPRIARRSLKPMDPALSCRNFELFVLTAPSTNIPTPTQITAVSMSGRFVSSHPILYS
jgi:hypothetical protein